MDLLGPVEMLLYLRHRLGRPLGAGFVAASLPGYVTLACLLHGADLIGSALGCALGRGLAIAGAAGDERGIDARAFNLPRTSSWPVTIALMYSRSNSAPWSLVGTDAISINSGRAGFLVTTATVNAAGESQNRSSLAATSMSTSPLREAPRV
jgi:hypothetical protein